MADVWRSDEPRVPEELDCIGVVGKAAADAFAHGNGRIPAGWPDSSFLLVETSLVGANGSRYPFVFAWPQPYITRVPSLIF